MRAVDTYLMSIEGPHRFKPLLVNPSHESTPGAVLQQGITPSKLRWPGSTAWRPCGWKRRFRKLKAVWSTWGNLLRQSWPPIPARLSKVGVRMIPPNALGAPNPTSSSRIQMTFGEPAGGRTGAGHHSFESASVLPTTPPYSVCPYTAPAHSAKAATKNRFIYISFNFYFGRLPAPQTNAKRRAGLSAASPRLRLRAFRCDP